MTTIQHERKQFSKVASSSFEKSDMINVNGTWMPLAEFRKMHKKTRKQRKTATDITILPSEVKSLLSSVRVMRSLAAYYDNGYKQWGNIAKTILNHPLIKKPFIQYNNKYHEICELLNDIDKIAKKNDKAVFQYVLKLSWLMDDARTQMQKICSAIGESGAIGRFAEHECINGEGRRLGLRILTIRSLKAISDIKDICQKLEKRSIRGEDVMQVR